MEGKEDDIWPQIKTKIEVYFQNKKSIEKKEDLDSFLEFIGLLEFWNTDEEKEVCWQSLNQYSKNGMIDCDAAINGIKNIINQEEDSFSKLWQIALDEYGRLDIDTLLQLKEIFSLLNVNKENTLIKLSKIEEICSENKSIKIKLEEIWKYLSFLSDDKNKGETSRLMNVHFTLFTEILNFINEKTSNDKKKFDNNEMDEDTDEDEPLDIIEKIKNNNDFIQRELKAFNDIIKSLNNLVGELDEKTQNILNGNDNNLDEVIYVKDLMIKKINDLNEYNKIIESQQKFNKEKMEKILKYINELKNDLQTLEEDYKALNNKYQIQQKDIDTNKDEIERLFGENLILYQDKEKLNEEKIDIYNKYNKLYIELENFLNKNKEMEKEMNDIKIKSLKYKTKYEDTLEKLISLEKIYNQELLKNDPPFLH